MQNNNIMTYIFYQQAHKLLATVSIYTAQTTILPIDAADVKKSKYVTTWKNWNLFSCKAKNSICC